MRIYIPGVDPAELNDNDLTALERVGRLERQMPGVPDGELQQAAALGLTVEELRRLQRAFKAVRDR